MPARTTLTLIPCLLVSALLGGCSDGPSSPAVADPLAGTAWVQDDWDAGTASLVFQRTEKLEGEVVGYDFGEEGLLTYRSFGFCATPPLSYFDVTGSWARADEEILELVYPAKNGEAPRRFEIVRLDADQLWLHEIREPAP